MIIGGGSRTNSRWFSDYLTKERTNEIARLIEIRGLPADNIPDAFAELRLLASASRQCTNHMYHAHINPRAEEALTQAQWGQALDTLEHNLGLDQQPRIVVEHEKEGRIHRHVIWGRIDPDTMKAISDSNNYAIHQRTADQLEKEFAHARTERGRDREGRDVEAEVRGLWRQADGVAAFAAALEANGYVLAVGDRGLCVIDPTAKEHSLYRRLALKKKEVDARMADIDRDALPSVDEARAAVKARMEDDRGRRDDAQAQPGHKKRDTALERVAGELVEAVGDALKDKGKDQEHSAADEDPPKAEAADAHAKENASPDLEPRHTAPWPDESAAAPRNYTASEPEPRRRPDPGLVPTIRRKPSLFDRLARTLSEVAQALDHGPTAAEVADFTARRAKTSPAGSSTIAPEISASARAAPASPSTSFEALAQDFTRDAKHAAPVLEDLAVAAGPELSAFERITQQHHTALRATGGEGLLFAEGLAWLANKLPPSDAPPPGRELTPFERVTHDIHEAIRENGGEPEPGFWKRGAGLLAAARDRLLEWAKEAARGFAERIQRSRAEHDQDKPGLER